MATNFPDTSVNNPATGAPWVNGDSYPDPETGLTYYWYLPVWKTAISPTGATDDKYVEVLGDNMTGNLTLGTDKITLDATAGTASFADNVSVGSEELKTLNGVKLFAAGRVDASRDAGTKSVWQGYTYIPGDIDASSGPTSVIYADGTAKFAGDIQSTSQNSGQLAGFRNQIINGDFSIVQRGAAGEAAVSRKYTCDRWYVHNGATEAYTWDQIDSPSDFKEAGFTKALRVRNASDVFQVRQLIELPAAGQRGQFIEGSTWTVSIYANAAVSCQIQWRDDATGDPGAVTGIIPLTAMTDEGGSRYTFTFTMPATAPQSTALGLGISFMRTDGTSSGLQVTGVQFEPGPVATPFEHRPMGTELALCQRYYYTDLNVRRLWIGNEGGNTRYTNYSFKSTMRAVPTIDITLSMGGPGTSSKVTTSGYYTAVNVSSTTNFTQATALIADAEL